MIPLFILFFLSFFVITNKSKKIRITKSTLFTKLLLLRAQTPKRKKNVSNKNNSNNTIEHLPQELVTNILSRLPAKELLECKRVCKSWFNLITDSHFISNYYFAYNNLSKNHDHDDGDSKEEKKNLLVIRRPFHSGLKTYITLLSCDVKEPKGNVIISSHRLNPPLEYNSDHKYWSEIMGPCNGIYFLEGNPNVMMNPSLRQFKALPESNFTSPNGTYFFSVYAGFGFDPKTNDYKVVTIKDLWISETDERKKGYWKAELYSLNSNSWRKIDDDDSLPLPFEIWGSSRVYTYVNNCCHWWGYVDDDDESGRSKDVVIAFDIVNEAFRKINVPRIRDSSEQDFATLVPFDESATIGVVVYPVRGKVKSYDVWVMKDYSDEGSWVKQYSVGLVDAISKVVGFYGSNEFLWRDSNEGLVLYDPELQETKDLKVYAKNDSLRAARYVESLVSLHRGNEFRRQCVSCSLVQEDTLLIEGDMKKLY